MIACAYNPSTYKTEAGELLKVQDHPGLCSKYQASQGYIAKTLLQNLRNRKGVKEMALWLKACAAFD